MEENNVISYKVEKHVWEDEKKKNRRKNILKASLAVATVFFLGISFILGYKIGGSSMNLASPTSKLGYIQKIMGHEWYFSKDFKNIRLELEDKAIQGMTSFDIDKHTQFLTSEENEAIHNSLRGTFYGIGVQYRNIGDKHVIQKVFSDSPAEVAGVKVNDIVIKVDGKSIVGKNTTEVAQLVRGEKGTDVTLTIIRNGSEQDVVIQRGNISATLESSVVNGVGILHLNGFNEDGGNEVEHVFDRFKNENVDKVIIDLRDNGGGYLKTTLEIAGLILPVGTVVLKQEDVSGAIKENRTTTLPRYNFKKVVLLINENSASASEVLTAALKEQANIPVVGVKSYGKGTVQITRDFKDGSALKYTVAQWISPKGNHINKVGVTPDYIVEQNEIVTMLINKFDETYKVDEVSPIIKQAQQLLKFLDYDPKRTDGYFSEATQNSIKAYQAAKKMEETGALNQDLLVSLKIDADEKYRSNLAEYDLQLKKALEIVNE